ncbi:hypothetical protein [Flavobacterium aquiphilum]|uniref:hypothetical protein n=1 Tax=Flavobacterium aquiphilum TaxID=3003261 RepID=UPI00247FDEF2|nr:hypothetical protein [Flavobacterium aquiphilum]
MRLTLAIDEDGDMDDVAIPEKYIKVNNICAVIYDQLTEVYKEKNYKNLFQTSITGENAIKFMEETKKSKIHALDWLKSQNLTIEIELVVSKQILSAVTSDLINFIFESMHAAKRGKMTVAYALLRKPFADELFILEQLLIDRAEFINRFFHIGDPETYDPSNRKLNKKEIIKKVFDKIDTTFLYDSELIYDLRYNKAFDAGINGTTNQALHIVTNDKNYKTTEQNFNFVFSQKNDYNRYFENYYLVVPNLLFYAVSVIDAIIFNFLEDEKNQNIRALKKLRRTIGFLQLLEINNSVSKSRIDKIFKIICQDLHFTCGKCKKTTHIERADLDLYFEIENFICVHCFRTLLHTKTSIKTLRKLCDKL